MHKLTLSERDLTLVAAALEFLRRGLEHDAMHDLADDAALLRNFVAERVGLTLSRE